MEDEEMDIRFSKAGAVMHALHCSVVMKRELSKKVKCVVFRSIFVPIFTYRHESWVMIERMRSRVQAYEMRLFSRIKEVTMLNEVCNLEIHNLLNVESLFLPAA